MLRKRGNGEGTIYRRRDGRYEGAVSLPSTNGVSKRVRVYGKTREEALKKLTAAKAQADQGVPVPSKSPTVGEYLDYWLNTIVRSARRPATYHQYEQIIRLYLKPGLGGQKVSGLTLPVLQSFLNRQLQAGQSVRQVQLMRAVLGSALTRAMREELVVRNVAHLVELPAWHRAEIRPWTADEALRFLNVSQDDPLYPAFVLLICYGMRRGEVLGLRWQDVDVDEGLIRVRQQLGRVGGQLLQSPVKTAAGNRDLPMLDVVRTALSEQYQRQAEMQQLAGDWWQGGDQTSGLVLTTASGRPVEPRNFARSFHRLCAEHDIRRIKVHHVRHTAATLMKKLKIPARDAQLILGHAQMITTQVIYQHADMDSRREALEQMEELILHGDRAGSGSGRVPSASGVGYRQRLPSGWSFLQRKTVLAPEWAAVVRSNDPDDVNSIDGGLPGRVTGMRRRLYTSWRCWLVGAAAVAVAVGTGAGSGGHDG